MQLWMYDGVELLRCEVVYWLNCGCVELFDC